MTERTKNEKNISTLMLQIQELINKGLSKRQSWIENINSERLEMKRWFEQNQIELKIKNKEVLQEIEKLKEEISAIKERGVEDCNELTKLKAQSGELLKMLDSKQILLKDLVRENGKEEEHLKALKKKFDCKNNLKKMKESKVNELTEPYKNFLGLRIEHLKNKTQRIEFYNGANKSSPVAFAVINLELEKPFLESYPTINQKDEINEILKSDIDYIKKVKNLRNVLVKKIVL